MYLCDHCGKLIAVTTKDPLIWTRLGRMHASCSTRAWEIERNPPPKPKRGTDRGNSGIPSIYAEEEQEP